MSVRFEELRSRTADSFPLLSHATLSFLNSSLGFQFASPVQQVAIPLLLSNRDVVVEACTGSGKTLAYLIPVIESILRKFAKKRFKQLNYDSEFLQNEPSEKLCGSISYNVGDVIIPCSLKALVMAPSRELAHQITEILKLYTDFVSSVEHAPRMQCVSLQGGRSPIGDCKAVRGILEKHGADVHLIGVATPGRLFDHLDNSNSQRELQLKLKLEICEMFVLDEADRMLSNPGFESQLSLVFSRLAKQRRTSLFSATVNPQMKSLVKAGLRNAVYVKVTIQFSEEKKKKQQQSPQQSQQQSPQQPIENKKDSLQISLPAGLRNYYVQLSVEERLLFLLKFFSTTVSNRQKVIVFFSTCAAVDYYYYVLTELIMRAANSFAPNFLGNKTFLKVFAIHGKKDAKKRVLALKEFCENSGREENLNQERHIKVLLATDVAARGLDFPAVDWIFQFEIPQDPMSFIHRIGRTARAGESGNSLVCISEHEIAYIPFLQNRGVDLTAWREDQGQEFKSEASLESIAKWDLPYSTPYSTNLSATDVTPPYNSGDDLESSVTHRVRALCLYLRYASARDREALDLGTAAFVASVRSYKEHDLKFLLPFKSLPLGRLAQSLGLLRLPRVNEILGQKIKDFVTEKSVDIGGIWYRDEAKNELARRRDEEAQLKRKVREAKIAVKQKVTEAATKLKARSKSAQKRARKERQENEWDELAKEARLIKKLKRGKLTEAEYEEVLRGDELELRV